MRAQKRREWLLTKYGNEEIVDRILRNEYWQGMTKGQLADSLGKPLDIDFRIMKTKSKEVWKYEKIGKNRYAKKIHFENDLLVGWEL